MESGHVIMFDISGRNPDPSAGTADGRTQRDAGTEPATPGEDPFAGLGHRDIDALLLREARAASDALMRASAALHAASSVVLEAAAALREERDSR